jgi:hypothetical protein
MCGDLRRSQFGAREVECRVAADLGERILGFQLALDLEHPRCA